MESSSIRVEHRRPGDLLGLDQAAPRLSWTTTTATPSWAQSAYEIEIAGAGGDQEPWRTGKVESAESVLVDWPAEPLGSRQQRTVRVRVWGPDDTGPSEWGEPTTFETGLLDPGEWTARFVGPLPDDETGADPEVIAPSPYLRREVTIDGDIAQARLYVSALGVYEVQINGRPVNDHVLPPGWTTYDHRLRCETVDVTHLLQPGPNVIGAVLGEGWYRGTIGWEGGKRNIYGDRLALLAQLEVVDADGARTTVVTDETWRTSTGAMTSSGLYDGEVHDVRREQKGWNHAGFDDESWPHARIVERDLTNLIARVGPPVRRTDGLHPTEIVTSPSGRTILDFGQNLVGRLRLRVPAGAAGTTITLRHAEVLQDGELCTAPLRLAEATDRLILSGDEGESEVATEWEPRFTFHGFRYAEVDGWPAPHPFTRDDVTAQVCHSDMERTGWFACSDDRVNRLHENIVWGMRGNFLDVPTDCPQRDERLGWTGDIQVFTPTACFLYDATGFLASWLGDLVAEQGDDGAVPFIVPNSLPFTIAAAAWGDAATIVPDHVAFAAGDDGLLRDQYPSMRAWVDHVVAAAGDNRLWDRGFQFGDWLDPRAPAASPADGRTDAHLVASAYLVRSLDIVARTADTLGNDDDAEHYAKLAGEVRAAFHDEYVTRNGRVASDSQTAYALALEFDLLASDAERQRAGRRLGQLVKHAGHKIATGFVGTPLICDALCRSGQADAAYQLLLQTECPSWLYAVTQGATTIWERWDGLQPDGTIDPDSLRMNSFNHYALGAVGDWLHRSVGGLAPAAPGWRELRIAPIVSRIDGAPTWARTRRLTPYGLAEVSWDRDGDTLTLTAVVPPNMGRLGGFHFNDSKYGDDDLTVGSITPFQLYLIVLELLAAGDGKMPDLAYMIDESHNLKDPLEDLIQATDAIQHALAQGLCLDRAALAEAQAANDPAQAAEVLHRAWRTDVRPLVAEARRRNDAALDPLATYRAVGYRASTVATRGSDTVATGL